MATTVGILKIFHCYLLSMVSRIELKLGGRHRVTWRFRIAELILFRYPRCHLENLQTTSARIELKVDGRHWGDMEFQNC